MVVRSSFSGFTSLQQMLSCSPSLEVDIIAAYCWWCLRMVPGHQHKILLCSNMAYSKTQVHVPSSAQIQDIHTHQCQQESYPGIECEHSHSDILVCALDSKQSRFETWLGSMHDVFGRDTLLSRCLFAYSTCRCIGYRQIYFSG